MGPCLRRGPELDTAPSSNVNTCCPIVDHQRELYSDALAERPWSAPASRGVAPCSPSFLEPEIPMLTVRRNGEWSVATVAAYEIVLRQELVLLQQSGKPRGLIVDIGGTWPQQRSVALALRRIEMRLGNLRPERIAVVSSFGASRVHARHLKQPDTQVFTSMKFAREWIIRRSEATGLPTVVFDQPIQADPEGPTVHIYGPI